jgi:hypothetical protein
LDDLKKSGNWACAVSAFSCIFSGDNVFNISLFVAKRQILDKNDGCMKVFC